MPTKPASVPDDQTAVTETVTKRFERLVVERERERFVLRLYVSGMTQRSTNAVEVVSALCEALLAGRYDLQVVDMYQEPERLREEQVVATPTLIRRLPLPERRVVGDLQDTARVCRALDIEPGADAVDREADDSPDTEVT